MELKAPTPKDTERQADELREAMNDTIAEFLNRERPDGVIVSMTALVVGTATALADMVVSITPPGPLRTDLSMMLVEQLGGTLMLGVGVPNNPDAVELHFAPPTGVPKN